MADTPPRRKGWLGTRRPSYLAHSVAVAAALLAAACAREIPAARTSRADRQAAEQLNAAAKRDLGVLEGLKPLPCDPGFLAPRDYVIAVSDWAERAGLKLGDRVVTTSIAGVSFSDLTASPSAHAAIPPGSPLSLRLLREREELTVDLPCHDYAEILDAMKRTALARTKGDWEGCIAWTKELPRLRRFTYSGWVAARAQCVAAKSRPPGKRDAARGARGDNPANKALRVGVAELTPASDDSDEDRLAYEALLLEISENRHEPGGVEAIRRSVLATAGRLRQRGFSSWADEIEARLGEAAETTRQ